MLEGRQFLHEFGIVVVGVRLKLWKPNALGGC